MVKVTFDVKEDSKELVENLINFMYSDNKSSSKQTNLDVCSKCGTAVDKKVVNFCKHQFDGVVLCRDCQKKEG